ncbi:MAG: LptF/LptG family permease [Candidatus Adiutrix sp.]
MSIINRYMVISFLRVWVLVLVGFVVFYSAVDFVEKIDNFLAKDIALKTIALFFIAQIPKIIALMIPVATLVATLISLSIMARASEIVAFKASGISLYRLSAPIVAVAVVICLLAFLMADQLAPRTNALANYIWNGQVKERQNISSTVEDIWLKGPRNIQYLGSYDELDGTVSQLSLIFLDEEMNLLRRLEADRGRFFEGRLYLESALEKTYPQTSLGEPPSFIWQRHDTLVIEDWEAPPQGFGRTDILSDEQSVAQLRRTIERLSAEGFGPVRQKVDLQFKFSFALLPLIMVVVGLPIAFWKEKGSGSIALGLTFGLGVSFAYLIAMEMAKSLGYLGMLPPIVAAWLPNTIFFLLGAYLFSYTRQ